ncbi:unnamed protein product [Orchesella dallaii]|uniref:Uncharacterized protein n=1 Tax=Orchesella dallaii TaxID=48710 RepID=A0ABP1RFR8_9HEXA
MRRVMMKEHSFFWVVIQMSLIVHQTSTTPIETPSSDVNRQDANEIAELWAELCGWKERTSTADEAVSKLRRAVGSIDGTISVSCEEPQPHNKVVMKFEAPPVQKQVIFVEIPDPEHRVELVQPPPPRVVIYVLPPEESHVFNVVDTREFKKSEPVVHFLNGNGIDGSLKGEEEPQRLARGVVGEEEGNTSLFDEDFEIIRAISYWADSEYH